MNNSNKLIPQSHKHVIEQTLIDRNHYFDSNILENDEWREANRPYCWLLKEVKTINNNLVVYAYFEYGYGRILAIHQDSELNLGVLLGNTIIATNAYIVLDAEYHGVDKYIWV